MLLLDFVPYNNDIHDREDSGPAEVALLFLLKISKDAFDVLFSTETGRHFGPNDYINISRYKELVQ
jgi:hypothetical protein